MVQQTESGRNNLLLLSKGDSVSGATNSFAIEESNIILYGRKATLESVAGLGMRRGNEGVKISTVVENAFVVEKLDILRNSVLLIIFAVVGDNIKLQNVLFECWWEKGLMCC